MKTAELAELGIDNLSIVEREIPEVEPNEVLVNIKAVSLNYLDLVLADGSFGADLPMPYTPSSDGAGVVEAVGDEVTEWSIGDRVLIHYMPKWQSGDLDEEANSVRVGLQLQGVLSEYITIPEYGLVKAPQNLTLIEGSTLPIAAITAWEGLINQANLQAGQTVLTQGTGGVSIFALQIAKAAGARVISTTSSEEKMEKLKELGADEVINYKKHPEWYKNVRELTNGEGVDVTLDIAGAATIANSMQSIKPHGLVCTVGFISGPEITLHITNHLNLNFGRVHGIATGNRESFKKLVQAVETNDIKPQIDSVFELDDVTEAYKHLESGSHFGKIVISL